MRPMIFTGKRNELSDKTKKFFKRRDWKLKDSSDEEYEFLIEKQGLKFPICCVSIKTLSFVSTATLLERMQKHTRQLKVRTSLRNIYVLGFDFPGRSASQFAAEGLIVTSEQDLDFIAEITRFLDENPVDLDPRQLLLFDGNCHYCTTMVERFEKAGQTQIAIDWARRAIKANTGFSTAYYKLFKLLEEIGDHEAAEQLAEEAVGMKRNDLYFLRFLHQLAVRRGDTVAASKWTRLINEAGWS